MSSGDDEQPNEEMGTSCVSLIDDEVMEERVVLILDEDNSADVGDEVQILPAALLEEGTSVAVRRDIPSTLVPKRGIVERSAVPSHRGIAGNGHVKVADASSLTNLSASSHSDHRRGNEHPVPRYSPPTVRLPERLQVPLPSASSRSIGAAAVSVEDHDHKQPESLPDWASDPGVPEESTSGCLVASLYVDFVRGTTGSPPCPACNEFFKPGDLRLGYMPLGPQARAKSMCARWVHAPQCIYEDNLRVRPGVDMVSFSPSVPASHRERVLAVLGITHDPSRVEPVILLPMPWKYTPAFVQKWPMRPVPGPAEPRAEASTLSVPGVVHPIPSASSISLAARAAIRQEWMESRRHTLSRHVRQATQARANELIENATASSQPKWQRDLNRLAPAQRLCANMEEGCVICHEPLSAGQSVRRLPCLHLFHKRCIQTWLSVRPTCPLCNLKLENMESVV